MLVTSSRTLAALVGVVAFSNFAAAQEPQFVVGGRGVGDLFGQQLVALGDVDLDGAPDFAVSAIRDSTLSSERGSVAVHSGVAGQLLYRIDGIATNDRFGWRLAAVDDLDGDGVRDLLVTAGYPPQGSTPIGRVEVRSGATGVLRYTLAATSAGANVFTFGSHIGGCGDVDLDGRGDFFVLATGSGSGRVRVHSGATGAFVREYAGATDFGESAASVMDLDGDGVRELAIGDRGYFQSNPTRRGRVLVHSGRTGALLRTHFGDATNSRFPVALADAGDVDRDGVGDLALSLERTFARSEVRIVSGASSATLREALSRFDDDDFGAALARIGDMDGDGFEDLAVGAPGTFGTLINAGAAYVLSGADGGELLRVPGSVISERIGAAVAGGGDLDGDGRADVLVGAPRFHPAAPPGRVLAFGRVDDDVVLDFELDDDFSTPLENGRAIGGGQRFGRVVQLAGIGPGHFGPATFDSSPTGPNAGGSDPDLLVGRGNVVILQAQSQQTVPGIFDVPDDFAGGGTLVVELLQPARAISLDLVDIDGSLGETAQVRLVDLSGRLRRYQVGSGYTGAVATGQGVRRLDLQTPFIQRGVVADASVSEDVGFDAGEVTRVEVTFSGSGAIDALKLRPFAPSAAGLRLIWSLPPPTSGGYYTFGSILRPAGDIDLDGHDDLLVGERIGPSSSMPTPFVQARSGVDGAVLRTFFGPPDSVSDALGELDLDGDAVPDVVMCGFVESTPALPNSGAARAFSGANGALLWERRGLAQERSAANVVGLGDVDNDGRDDLVLAPAGGSLLPYTVRVVSGATGMILRSIALPNTASSYGALFASGGDMDGDGIDDLLVGLPGDDTGAFDGGRIQVYSGATGALVAERFGAVAGRELGLRVGILDDLDGDGRAEAWVMRIGGTGGYTSDVVAGADLVSVRYTLDGLPTTLGDLDGDGVRDLATSFAVTGPLGVLYTAEGRSGLNGALLFREQHPFDSRFAEFSDAGDSDGDGFDDLAWSRTDPSSSNAFAIEVHSLARANGAAVCFGAASSTGFRAVLRASGSFQVAANDLTLTATGLPSGTLALLLSSPSYGIFEAPAIGGVASDGDLCIAGGPVTRHGSQLAVGLVAVFPLNLGALPTIQAPGGVRAAIVGETRFWQCWYRDNGFPGRSNFSDAIRVTFE